MSLISEALKKARQEAARQEALRRGVAPPPLPHHMPLRRQRPPWLAALAGGFLGAAILTAAALWLLAGGSAPAPAPAPPLPGRVAPPAVPEPTAAPEEPAEEPAPAAPASARPVEQPAATAPAPPEPVAAPVGHPTAPRDAPRLETAPAAAVPEAPAPRQPASRRAELPDGTVLVLQGIAVTDGRPVALVNGIALGPGERVEGFTVQSIDALRVELRRGDLVVTLALR